MAFDEPTVEVIFSDAAKAQFKKLAKHLKQEVFGMIEQLEYDEMPAETKPMDLYNRYFITRFGIHGDYRMITEANPRRGVIWILACEHRQIVYAPFKQP